MARIGTETKVGLAVLLGVILLTYMTFTVGGYRFGKKEGYLIYAVFDSVAGVDLKTPVKIAGVTVGEVEKIELVDGAKARVTLRIQSAVKIRQGAQTVLRSTGLLGEKYIEIIVPEAPEHPAEKSEGQVFQHLLRGLSSWLTSSAHAAEVAAQESPDAHEAFVREGETIRQKGKSADIDQLITQLGAIAEDIKAVSRTLRETLGTQEGERSLKEILENIRQVTENLRGVLSENRQGVDQIVANLKEFTENLKEISGRIQGGSGTLGKLYTDEELFTKLKDAVTDLGQVAKQVQSGQGTVGKLIYDEEAYNRLNAALADVKEITGKISSGEGTVGKLIYEEETYENLNSTLKSLSAGLERLEQLKILLDFRAEYQLDTSDNKGYFSLKVQPRDYKYYMVQVVDEPRGDVEKTTVQTSGTTTASTTTLKTERKLKFSVLLARRFGDFWVRAGLMENTFGLGGDYMLWDDHVRFGVDLWDFNSNDPDMERSRLKFTLDWSIFKYVVVQGGYDNVLNRDIDTFFLGGAIRFEDEDLKYLIGSVPTIF